jgi:hypothetical protein
MTFCLLLNTMKRSCYNLCIFMKNVINDSGTVFQLFHMFAKTIFTRQKPFYQTNNNEK